MLTATRRKLQLDNSKIISPKQRQIIQNFAEGYIDKLDINMLPSNSFYDCLNVVMDSKGSVETRTGVQGILDTAAGAYRIRQQEFCKVNGSNLLFVSYSNKVAYVNTTTKAVVDTITGLSSSTAIPDFVNLDDILYAISDGDTMQAWDGSSTWACGLTAPATAPSAAMSIEAPEDKLTASEGAATGLTGAYLYKVTFTTAVGESGPGPYSTVRTVTDKKIDLSNIPIGATGTTSRKIYRTKAYGIMFYLLTTVADNTTTTYTDSTADTALGAAPPDSKNLNGKYKYAVSFVYGDRGESPLGDKSTEVDIDNGQVAVSSIPVGGAGAGVTQRKVYRTKGDDEDGDLRKLTTIDDNTTTTYTDNEADATLDSVGEETAYNTLDFSFGVLKKKSSTLWAVDNTKPTTIYLTDPNCPEQCPVDNYITLPDTNDKLIVLVEYFDDIYAFMTRKIYKITGDDIDTASVSVVSQTAGCVAKGGLQHARQDMVFLSYDGLYTLSRVLLSSSENTIDVKPMSEKVGKTFEGLNWNYVDRVATFVYKNFYGISFPKDSATQNNFTFYYGFDGKNWSIFGGKFGFVASYAVGDLEDTNEYKLHIGSSAQDGKIYDWPNENIYNDDGQAFDSYFILAPFSGNFPESRKRHNSFFIEAEASGDWDLYIWYRKELRTDKTAGWSQKTISLNPNITAAVGTVPGFYPVKGFYPVTSFGGRTDPVTTLVISDGKPLSGQSKYIQFKIGNDGNANEHFKVFKFIYYFRVKKPRT